MIGKLALQEIDLPLQISLLLGAGHSGVDVGAAFAVVPVRSGDERDDVRQGVPSVASGCVGAREPAELSPISKRLGGDAETPGSLGGLELRYVSILS